MATPRKKIVTIGGGTGQFTLLSGLRDLAAFDITAVVSMMDSGGSTGRLRDEFGVLPPGDALKCILALSPHHEFARRIFLRRFSGTGNIRLRGHNAGNMLLTILSRYTGSFPTGIVALAEILEIRGTILPVTIDRATLVAELFDGSRIFGESAIDLPIDDNRDKIKELFLVPHYGAQVSVYPPVTDAISEADVIVIGPGDLFTSIIPNLIVPGVREAIEASRSKIIYVLNIMTKPGETDGFRGNDFVNRIEEMIHRTVDVVVYNTEQPAPELLEPYQVQGSDMVQIDMETLTRAGYTVSAAPILNTSGGILRHDSRRLAELIQSCL